MTKSNTFSTEQKDPIVSFVSGIIDFCKRNKRGVITGIALIALAAIVGGCYASHVQKVTQNSWAAYYTAQVALLNGEETEGFALIDQLAKKYPGTPAAQYALLFKGDILYNAQDYTQAAAVYQSLLSSKNPTVFTVATLSLAASHQALKEYPAAIELLQQFIQENPKNFALPQAYLTLALSQELANQKKEALASYEYLANAYAQTYFASMAKQKIIDLQK